MKIVVFEDEKVGALAPVVVGRPAFSISCGGWRLIDLLAEVDCPIAADVRPHLRPTALVDYPPLAAIESAATAVVRGGVMASGDDLTTPAGAWPLLLVNARAVPSLELLATLKALAARPEPGIIRHGESIAVACLTRPGLPAAQGAVSSGAAATAPDGASDAPASVARLLAACGRLEGDAPLFDHPHDILRYHLLTFVANLEHLIARCGVRQTSPGLFLAPTAKLGQHVVVDASRGPIVIADGAEVGPFTLLTGPALLGPRARVNAHAAIREFVALGHTTKIGGELEASIIEPYTNKQHHGFIGHSYLGSWVNLGAGTCNSDLKNTYGQVNVEYHGRKVATGMQFVGATVGDYAKTAINTGIFTGKTIGVCSMVYGFVTTNVPSFVNYARLFGQVTEAPVEVMVATQKRMFARRGVEQRPSDIQLLHDMYALTAAERRLGGETLSIEPLSL